MEPGPARDRLAAALTGRGMACSAADRPAGSHAAFDSVLTDRVEHVTPGPAESVVLCTSASFDAAARAIRAGASDVVPAAASLEEICTRTIAAAQRSRSRRDQSSRDRARQTRVRDLCRALSTSRRELTGQIGSLCTNLADAYRDLADQMSLVTLAAEFNGVIRQELDLESVLRVGLEYMLAKTGPTNAAVFLPATSGDFSLGAYVNYDIGADSAEVLMDHLAAAAAPRLESRPGPTLLACDTELQAHLGEGAEWIRGTSAITFACVQDGDCLAAFVFFRDRSTPFTAAQMPTIKLMADLFGRQLARVVKVHHRHLPKHKWGSPGDPFGGSDDIDLAA